MRKTWYVLLRGGWTADASLMFSLKQLFLLHSGGKTAHNTCISRAPYFSYSLKPISVILMQNKICRHKTVRKTLIC